MNFDFENPFADYGNIVSGNRFIGRKNSLRIIENRILRPQEPGNLAIIGEPRIGKSSLVNKAIPHQSPKFCSGLELVAVASDMLDNSGNHLALPAWIRAKSSLCSAILCKVIMLLMYGPFKPHRWLWRISTFNQPLDRLKPEFGLQ